jgi:uncharacterized protein
VEVVDDGEPGDPLRDRGTRRRGAQVFYGDLIDWEIQPAGPEYWLLRSDGEGIGGGLLRTRAELPSYVTVYVAVQDLRATLDRATVLGGKPVVEPTDIPGIGQFAMFSDPEGNLIGLLHTS